MTASLIWITLQTMTFHVVWKSKTVKERISMILGFMIINVILLAGGFYDTILIKIGWIQF